MSLFINYAIILSPPCLKVSSKNVQTFKSSKIRFFSFYANYRRQQNEIEVMCVMWGGDGREFHCEWSECMTRAPVFM